MFKRLPFITFILFTFSVSSQNSSLVLQYQNKINRCLDKQNELSAYYLLDTSGISIYESPECKAKNQVEYKVYWNEIKMLKPVFKNYTSEELLKFLKTKKSSLSSGLIKIDSTITSSSSRTPGSLKGKRIAIDPGHIADNMEMAKTERKFIDMKVGASGKASLIEAQLTLATALILKKQLEKQGAIVMLTRSKPGETSFGISYDEWLKTSLKAAVDSAISSKDITEEDGTQLLSSSKKEVFKKLFSTLETKERARKINLFNPDFTIIIHYNVDEKNTGWEKPTKKDFNMAFVGGSFMKDEMEKSIYRAEFLRLLLTNDIENSVDFSSYFINSFQKNLKIPTAGENDADYLKKYCIPTEEKGVFCRNLTLTRMVHGTLVYGETLYQDNIDELQLLSKNEITVNGINSSKRVQQVADAYFDAVVTYMSRNK